VPGWGAELRWVNHQSESDTEQQRDRHRGRNSDAIHVAHRVGHRALPHLILDGAASLDPLHSLDVLHRPIIQERCLPGVSSLLGLGQ
jgi:hypothetical protein